MDSAVRLRLVMESESTARPKGVTEVNEPRRDRDQTPAEVAVNGGTDVATGDRQPASPGQRY
jgi:hypothetical protein